MEKFNLSAFTKNLEEEFSEAGELVSKLEKYSASYDFPQGNDPLTFDEIEYVYREALKSKISSILIKLTFALERLGCPVTAKNLTIAVRRHEVSFGELSFEPALDAYWSEPIRIERQYFKALKAEGEAENGRDKFYREILLDILKNTPKLIHDEKLEPKKEKDVKDLIYKIVSAASFDIVKEIPIQHHVKVYKPDFGVKSLGVAIEYKFCDNETELKTCLGGIFEDVHGYAGSKDWTSFIAIIYCTNHFVAQQTIERESKLANLPENWTLIPVFGTGGRAKKLRGKLQTPQV